MQSSVLTEIQLKKIWCGPTIKFKNEKQLSKLARTMLSGSACKGFRRDVKQGRRIRPDEQIFDMVDEVLWHEWDPIGVNDMEAFRDEYRALVYDTTLVLVFGTQQQLAAELFFNERYYLSFRRHDAARRCCDVAALLVSRLALALQVSSTVKAEV